MSVKAHRIERPSKALELARFDTDTLQIAVRTGRSLVVGWTGERYVDENTRIIIQANLGNGSKVIGDGWAKSKPRTDDDRFGNEIPYTTKLVDFRLIADPENFLEPVTKGQGAFIGDPGTPTFSTAAIRVVELDRLWAQGMTVVDDVSVVESW